MNSSSTPSQKLIILSGGSRGLGHHIAEHLLRHGHAVATFARRSTDGCRALAERFGDAFSFTEADACDLPSIRRLVDAAIEKHGAVTGLINNAAIGQDHLLVHASDDVIRKILAVNLEAPILLTRIVLKHMLLQAEGGRILNISSICGIRGYTGLTAYSATKGGMDAFTRSLAHEVGSRKILVNSIAPGFFESEMSSVLSPEQLSTIKRRTPTNQLVNDANLLPLIDLLLFADVNITGQSFVVDGGISS